MDFFTAIKTCFRNYAGFRGRAPRSEFWWFGLFFFIGSALLAMIETRFLGFGAVERVPGGWAWQSNGGPLTGLFALGMVVPLLAVAVRRLHDLGKSGWWLLISLVPFFGTLVLLYFYVQPSQPGPNAFGPAPDRSPPPLP
ncbi:DUF805 domain-containing protein [Rhodobacter lacus]|uniref:DUF805 domain-containing protein n=1 Tax=Rhodobacter lacus TaxID=1641972 RepID=A0ABW5A346_9RHOB